MPVTKRGIYHNLRESKYTASNTEVVFFFSSVVYLNKFMNGYQENRNKKKYHVNAEFNMDTLADIEFYIKTEKRGFFARLNKGKLSAKLSVDDLYLYAKTKLDKKTTLDWVTNSGR